MILNNNMNKYISKWVRFGLGLSTVLAEDASRDREKKKERLVAC
jgi:hypothetical protein